MAADVSSGVAVPAPSFDVSVILICVDAVGIICPIRPWTELDYYFLAPVVPPKTPLFSIIFYCVLSR